MKITIPKEELWCGCNEKDGEPIRWDTENDWIQHMKSEHNATFDGIVIDIIKKHGLLRKEVK